MKHLRLLLKLLTGFLWAALVAVVAGYIALNEEYLAALDAWRK